MTEEQLLSRALTTTLGALPNAQLVEITRRAALGSFEAACRGLLRGTPLADVMKSLFPEIPEDRLAAVERDIALTAIRNTSWGHLLSLPGQWDVCIRCHHHGQTQPLRERSGPAIAAMWHLGADHMVCLGLRAIGVPAMFVGSRMPGAWFRHGALPGMEFVLSGETGQSTIALKRMIDRLRKGGVVAIAADGSSGQRDVEMSFLGRRMLFSRGIAVLARLTRAPIVPILATWGAKDWSIDFHTFDALPLPPLDVTKPEDWEREAIVTTVKFFEGIVRAHPGQVRLEQIMRYIGRELKPTKG